MIFSQGVFCAPPIFPDWVYELNAMAQEAPIPYTGPCMKICCWDPDWCGEADELALLPYNVSRYHSRY